MIPITRNGSPIVFNEFINGRDEAAGIYVDERVARLAKGIPNDKVRPVIELPWELSFNLRWFKNTTFDEKQLQIAFERGGIAMGLGTFRGVFGKFTITKWD